jgi:Ca2+-transporting ATPase
MPRDTPFRSVRPAVVVGLPPGPLGPRWRVRGLRDNPALAAWLQARVEDADVRVIASAASGIVRIDARRTRSARDWGAELAQAVAAFGAVALPRPSRSADRRQQPAARRADEPPRPPRAERTISALRKLAPRSAIVLRDGQEMQVPAREIVAGDVLVLKPGEAVAADARVLESHRLSANEAPLTGESLPVRKEPIDRLAAVTPLAERRNMLHMGTVISGGTGRAVVVATGERTVLGGIRALAQTTEAPRTRLQTELDGLGKRLAIGASGLCLGVFAIGALRGRPLLPLLRTAVSLGVAAIPEGLPTVATSLLAAGIRTLQKRNVYARSLDAIENLGAVDVVGFDKTGTLTQNRMSVASVVIGRSRVARHAKTKWPADLVLVCALCNDVERANGSGWQGSSTEIALLELIEPGVDVDALRRRHRRLAIKQRSEHHPYMVTLHSAAHGQCLVTVKGRPQEVLERCTTWFDGRRVAPLTAATRRHLLAENDALAALGQRVLALAIKRHTKRTLGETGALTWLGLVGLADPLRPGIAKSIARFRAAGIRPVMLTGDQIGTARAVARAAGLDGAAQVVDAGALPEDAQQLGEVVDRAAAFARSSPAMKLQIIRALQDKGHVVAMTGDGINDGPALKTADVGVAMGASGTDFAQAMSDLVLWCCRTITRTGCWRRSPRGAPRI